MAIEMNKPVYFGFSILDISKKLMYELWYVKAKYQWNCIQQSCPQDKAKLCYMVTDSFIIHIKTEDFYEDIANDVEKCFDTSNYDDNRPLPVGMNKKVINLFNNELGRKIMKEFVALKEKTFAYLMDDDTEYEKAKGTKKCVIKIRLIFKNYLDYLFNDKMISKSQQRFKSDYHNAYTEQINKIRRSINDDKRLQKFDKITTYPSGTNAFKVCEIEMISKK